jgi:hypothetical protein
MSVEGNITVSFVEMDGSPSDGFDISGRFFATRQLRCEYADRITLMKQLKGKFRDASNQFVLPQQYPWFPEARVTAVSSQPWSDTKGTNAAYGGADYTYSLVTVQYAVSQVSFQSSEDDDVIVSHRLDGGAEFLTIGTDPQGPNPLYWNTANDRVKEDQGPSKLLSILRWTVQIDNARTIDSNAQSMLGQINEAVITAKFLPPNASISGPVEQVRYDYLASRETFDSDGNQRWAISLGFSIIQTDGTDVGGNPVTWNHAFPPGRDEAERLFTHPTDRDATKRYNIYKTVNLNTLLDAYM